MKSKIAGVALAAVMACRLGGIQHADAALFTYTLYGYVTSADSVDASLGDLAKAEIGIDTSYPNFNSYAVFYDLKTGMLGSGDGSYFNQGVISETGASVGGADVSGNFGMSAGMDGGFNAGFTLLSGTLPTNPNESFGPTSAVGSAFIQANPVGYDPDTGLPIGGFSFGFTVTAVAHTGVISPVPLPSSAPLLGMAILALGASGYSLQLYRRA